MKEMLAHVGKHVINLFIQYTPYQPSDGSWQDTAYRVSLLSYAYVYANQSLADVENFRVDMEQLYQITTWHFFSST